MRRSFIHLFRHSGDQSSESLFQASLSRYLRAFSKARAMRFWRPRIPTKVVSATAFAASLTLGACTSYAQFPSVIELNNLDSADGFVINGIDAEDRCGSSVSNAGDINGDGIDDFIIGAYAGAAGGNALAGESYVIFGSDGGFSPSFDLSNLDGTNGFQINGGNAGERSGSSVSGAGDVNGDGIDDLIIGAPFAEPGGNEQAGVSYVVFGNDSGFSPSLNLSNLDGINGFQILGISERDRSGGSVSGAGDFNGDGIDDLIIGAMGADINGARDAGQSYIVFGSDGGFSATLDLASLNGINGFQINGGYSDQRTGRSVSGAGDINGDGFDDLIIGAPFAGYSIVNTPGVSYVVFGSNGGSSPSFNLNSLDGTNGFQINGVGREVFGVTVGGLSGQSVSGAGDVNGDGIDDLIIGAPYAYTVGNLFAGGESYVVFGSNGGFSSALDLSSLDGANGFRIDGVFDNNYSGTSVSSAGDINGDGINDLIIGAYGANFNNSNSEAGVGYVVFGSNGGFSPSFSLSSINGANGFQINVTDPNGYSRRVVSGAGDINADGIDDLILGGSLADPNGNARAGESHVLFGRSAADVLKGDVDMDGDVDFLDIGPFIAVLASAGFQAEADVDCSGVVDFLDIQPFIVRLQQN